MQSIESRFPLWNLFHLWSFDMQLKVILYVLWDLLSLPWSWIVCRVACRRLCRKRESDRALACRILARSSGTRRRCALLSSKARDVPRCWTTAISETGKIEQTLLSGPSELRVTAKYASLYYKSRLEVSQRLILLHENWDLTDLDPLTFNKRDGDILIRRTSPLSHAFARKKERERERDSF